MLNQASSLSLRPVSGRQISQFNTGDDDLDMFAEGQLIIYFLLIFPIPVKKVQESFIIPV